MDDREFAVRLARALYGTGKLSVREVSREVAKHGLVGRDGKPLLPGTLWRILKKEYGHQAL